MRLGGEAIDALTRFLPYADNWAVTDTIRIRALRRAGADADAQLMLNQLEHWMQADATYTVRYAVVELMTDFLDSVSMQRICALSAVYLPVSIT